MENGEKQLEETLRSLKNEVVARPVLLRDTLDEITKPDQIRSYKSENTFSFLSQARFLMGTLAIFIAVIVGNNFQLMDKEVLSRDVTDLLLDSQELALEMEEIEWILEEDTVLLDIDLESEIL